MTVTVPPNNNNTEDTACQPHRPLHPANRFDSSISRIDDIDCPVENVVDELKRRELPPWVKEGISQWGERIFVPEWDNDEVIDGEERVDACDKFRVDGQEDGYRSKNGWKGSDLCHSKQSPVRISHYGVQYKEGGVGTTLTGVAHFTNNAESHAGFCHGGSMTCVMDDVIGWTAFLVTGECCPWSGFTAQVNVSLKRPIAVGSYLKIIGTITKWEGRKVWIHSQLLLVGDDDDESEGIDDDDDVVHCTAEGLVILKR